MESASFREIACAGALDEISNAEDGKGIELAVRRGGLVRDGKTSKSLLFVVYQTDRHGPQNGFRLALVMEGVSPERAREELKAVVAQDSVEYVVVRP